MLGDIVQTILDLVSSILPL